MGDPHNPARYGELWNPYRYEVLKREIEAVKEYGALSGGWAWHYMSPPHLEEKHLHDHRDIDLHVFPNRFAELVVVLEDRGYERQKTRFDDPSGEFIRYEKHIFPCPQCGGHGEYYDSHHDPEGVEQFEYLCTAQDDEHWFHNPEPVKVIFDLFIHEVPTIESNGYTVVEPNHMLTFYGVKHSSEQCVSVQAARKIQAEGGEIVGNPLLVEHYAIMTHFMCGTCKGEYDRGFKDRGQDYIRERCEVVRYAGDQNFYCCLCGAYGVPDAVFQTLSGISQGRWCRNQHDTEPPEDWEEDD